jgi:hypothetical protein
MTPLIELAYLAAAVLFIIGLKRMSHPSTARRGNQLSAIGMLIAIAVTLLDRQIVGFGMIAVGVLVGSGLGLWMARAVPMTSMPQMVGLLNGFGGGASTPGPRGNGTGWCSPARMDVNTLSITPAPGRRGDVRAVWWPRRSCRRSWPADLFRASTGQLRPGGGDRGLSATHVDAAHPRSSSW